MSKPTLEQRVAQALKADVASGELEQLVRSVQDGIAAADADLVKVREQALDPIAEPDANRARGMVEDAIFRRDRLNSLLPRLNARYQEVLAAEAATQWLADFDQVKQQRDAFASEVAEIYPKAAQQLAELFSRLPAIENALARINSSAPAGQHQRIRPVLPNPAALRDLKLPKLDQGGQYWPLITDAQRSARLAAQQAEAIKAQEEMFDPANWEANWKRETAARVEAANKANPTGAR